MEGNVEGKNYMGRQRPEYIKQVSEELGSM